MFVIDADVRRAALIATGVTVPLVVLIALGIGALSGATDSGQTPDPEPTGAIAAVAPPRAAVDAAACAKVLAQLPVSLGPLKPRIVRPKPDTPFVVAWGNPAVILRCGENRPAVLNPSNGDPFVNAGSLTGPFFDVQRKGDDNVWTSVDRAAYISVIIPSKYQGADVMQPLAAAIGKALPAVCTTDNRTPDVDKLCTRRK